MFKAPDKHVPREWGQPSKAPLFPSIILGFAVTAFLIALAIIPPVG